MTSVNEGDAFVPFSWEEKPGVPKKTCRDDPDLPSFSFSSENQLQLVCATPLRKPPCLEVISINKQFSTNLYAKPLVNVENFVIARKNSGRRPRLPTDHGNDPFLVAIHACMDSTSNALVPHTRDARRTDATTITASYGIQRLPVQVSARRNHTAHRAAAVSANFLPLPEDHITMGQILFSDQEKSKMKEPLLLNAATAAKVVGNSRTSGGGVFTGCFGCLNL